MLRTLVAIAFLVIGQAIAWPFTMEFLAVDRCLDAGGSFDYDTGRCDFGAVHPGVALWQRHGGSLVLAGAFGVLGCVLLLRRRKS
jgi:hypothetical protein